jgi:hypothetical protein
MTAPLHPEDFRGAISRDRFMELREDQRRLSGDHDWRYWDFYIKWFGRQPHGAPDHIDMDAMVERVIDVTETVLLGGIPWNLKFAGPPRQDGGKNWSIMVVAAKGYSFGVRLDGYKP